MSRFVSYLRNDKGGAVEYVLVMAAVGSVVLAVGSSATVKTAINNMFQSVFDNASKKSTMG